MVILTIIVAGLMLFVAGALVLRLSRFAVSADPVAWLGLSMVAGLSSLALLLEISGMIRWTPATVRLLFLALLVALVILVPWGRMGRLMRRTPRGWQVTVGIFLLLVVSLAVAQVGDTSVAPGVDSVHHLMLTRLIVDQGGLPGDLEPYIRGGRLAYHWGIHGNVAFAALFMGRLEPFEVSELIVAYSALLRIICSLSMYAAARSLFASRFAAIAAGSITAAVSALPAALVSQGRFTHLAGVAVLAALVAIRPRDHRRVSAAVVAAILLAGVFLIQARLVVFGVAWVLVAAIGSAPRRPIAALARAAVPLLITGVLVLPHVLQLVQEPLVLSMVRGSAFAQEENRWTQRHVPPEMIWLDNNGLLLSGATAGLTGVAGAGVSRPERIVSALWLLAVMAAVAVAARRKQEPGRRARRQSRRKRRIQSRVVPFPWRPLLIVLAWVAVSSLFLFARSPGLDLTTVVPYAAGALTYFIPLILMTSGILAWVTEVLVPSGQPAAVIVLLVFCGVAGLSQHERYEVRSPVPEADREAMNWIDENLAESAIFAVMARPFHGIFVGEDAGYWIHVLTDRRSLLPPMIYGWVSPVSEVERTNELLRIWTTIHPDSSVLPLVDAGATHAYLGSAAHPQARSIMRESRRFRVIYDRDGVMIAEMRGGPYNALGNVE